LLPEIVLRNLQYVVDQDAPDTVAEMSGRLFGRQHALRVYAAIAALPEDFTARQVRELSGAPTSDVSRELSVLRALGMVIGKRNRCRRTDSILWDFATQLLADWSGERPADQVTPLRGRSAKRLPRG
jgi:hypothetical protein